MDSQKPKKALRGLFSKTEESTETAPIKLDIKTDTKAEEVQKVTPLKQVHSVAEEKNQALANTTAPYSFVKIQYNLDLFKAERGSWQEQDYISFINKIDQAQTDAFFLKGKLVSEIKGRFYLDNKRGWAIFCDETLNMNYTTANQYIRVSQEFDVTSHQREDFGFEHFKALLPLAKEVRNELLTQTPKNLSVKSLRDLVAKKILGSSPKSTQEKNTLSAKNIVETLQKLKLQLSRLNSITLSQEDKWQLHGAFQNISEEMNLISNSFISTPELKAESRASSI
ncbi:MAG: hypothetical protein V4591_03025 [Bdellovibrionota bacterium]